MSVAIIDYGSGNLRSAAKAFERMARERGLGTRIDVTSDPDAVRRAERIVLPGVGAFGDCRRGLDALPGMVDVLQECVRDRGKPFLGICVGMQLMATRGLEHGVHPGLGWIAGDVDILTLERSILPTLGMLPEVEQILMSRIPHMGWNEFTSIASHPVLNGIQPSDHMYFVHSYGLRLTNPKECLAITDYSGGLVSIVGRDNMIGTQFHPEKSMDAGLTLIGNFLTWKP